MSPEVGAGYQMSVVRGTVLERMPLTDMIRRYIQQHLQFAHLKMHETARWLEAPRSICPDD